MVIKTCTIQPPYLSKPIEIFSGLVLILISISFSDCATILYGYKNVTTVDEVWAEELASKANVDSQHLLFLDSLETVSLANFVCGSNKSVQPLQLHVVMSDSIVSSYFNCYTTGNLRSLQWKFENINHNLVDGDCVFSDSSLSTLLRDLVKTRKGDIMLVIFSSMFKKQSEHLVKVAAGRSTGFTLYLINIDAYYANILNK